MTTHQNGIVYFIGAGPGDPELITVAGQRRIAEASLVLYAGSLVPRALIPSGKRAVDTAPLTLDAIVAHMRDEAGQGGVVARLHTGDPALYGALREEIRELEIASVPWKVIPGVTAACAAAAAAGISFTVPGVTQSLVITRLEGRTPMPPSEAVTALASHHTSLALYLSSGLADRLEEELRTVLPGSTSVLCAHKVGHPDERLVWTTVDRLSACVKAHGIEKKTVILVLPGEEKKGLDSRLYAPDFSHAFRPHPKDKDSNKDSHEKS